MRAYAPRDSMRNAGPNRRRPDSSAEEASESSGCGVMAGMHAVLNRLRRGGARPVSSPGLRANLPNPAAANQAVHSLGLSASQRAALEELFAERKEQELAAERERRTQQKLFARRKQPRRIVSNYETVEALERKNFAILDVLTRAHMGQGSLETGLYRAPGAVDANEPDKYLAAILKHTARTGGSEGQVLSLTNNPGVSGRFSREGSVPRYRIYTAHAPEDFRSAVDIIAKDGPRLVAAGEITKNTLFSAMNQLDENEDEVFYIKGDIPAHLLMAP